MVLVYIACTSLVVTAPPIPLCRVKIEIWNEVFGFFLEKGHSDFVLSRLSILFNELSSELLVI